MRTVATLCPKCGGIVCVGFNQLDAMHSALQAAVELIQNERDGLVEQLETQRRVMQEAYNVLGPRTKQPCSCEGCDCENGMAAAALEPFVDRLSATGGRQ